MTARQIYEASLTEKNKTLSPSLLLEDFNYFLNKTIIASVNEVYKIYDINQEGVDDLRVLKFPYKITSFGKYEEDSLNKNTFIGSLPDDYLHILNCIAGVQIKGCDKLKYIPVKRLTTSLLPSILNNYYHKPSIRNPYFYLHNTEDNIPISYLEQVNDRKANHENVKIEVLFGQDSGFVLKELRGDYLKYPRYVKLTHEQIESEEDISQKLEFSKEFCYDIIKKLSGFLLENSSNPRLQTNIPVNQTTSPQQQQQTKR